MTKSKNVNRKVTYTDRVSIQELRSDNASANTIAKELDRAKSTVLRELKRCKGVYNAKEAQLDADEKKREKDEDNRKWRSDVTKRIDQLERAIRFLLKDPLQ